MINEHDVVVVTKDVPEHALQAEDTAGVVAIHARRGQAAPLGYLVEIFAVDGSTIDVVDVPADAVRPALPSDSSAARPVAAE
jgi:Domain of unknown function (DUF4926)